MGTDNVYGAMHGLLSNEIDKAMLAEAVKEIAALREERDGLRAGLTVATKALEGWVDLIHTDGQGRHACSQCWQTTRLLEADIQHEDGCPVATMQAALSTETIAAEIESQRATASILGKLRGLLGEIEGAGDSDHANPARGASIWLSHEEWGIVYDGLIQESATALGRQARNPENTASLRLEMCKAICSRISAITSSGIIGSLTKRDPPNWPRNSSTLDSLGEPFVAGKSILPKRDPRIDPHPGDVVRMADSPCHLTVSSVGADGVRVGYNGLSRDIKIVRWREPGVVAEVIHVAG